MLIGIKTNPKAFARVDIPDSFGDNRTYKMRFSLDDKFDSELLRKYVQRELYDNIKIELRDVAIHPSSRREATSTLNVIYRGFDTINIYLYDGVKGKELCIDIEGKDINKKLVYAAQHIGSQLMMTSKRDLMLEMNLSARLPELRIYENLELRK